MKFRDSMSNDKQAVELFHQAYLTCALWSSTNDQDEPLDGIDADVSGELYRETLADCLSFINSNWSALNQACELPGYTLEQAGHDFWLTRNRHGAGFWDRGLGGIGERLTEASHAEGSRDLYIGDDGEVYQQ